MIPKAKLLEFLVARWVASGPEFTITFVAAKNGEPDADTPRRQFRLLRGHLAPVGSYFQNGPVLLQKVPKLDEEQNASDGDNGG